jgi:hypothetical protein
MTPTSISDLTTATPAEIDTRLFALYLEARSLQGKLAYTEKALTRPALPYILERLEADLAEAAARLAEVRAEVSTLDDEFRARGGWLRYFLVTNGNGHVHREMDCRTCYPTTEYAWLPALSDCDEGQMVEQYGEMACTVCFPEAPAHPAFQRSLEERKAAEAAKAATECPGSRQGAINITYRYSTYGQCAVCGEGVAVTTNGNARTHRPMSVRLAEEAAKEAEKVAKAEAAAARKATKGKSPQERRYDALSAISAAYYGPAFNSSSVRETDWDATLKAAHAALDAGRTAAWKTSINRIIALAEKQDDTWMTQALINASHSA